MSTSYEMAPPTKRGARSLSRIYGFESVDHMAESLPANAQAADFGAGRSNLGLIMARLRTDITWSNVDLRGFSRYRQETAPDNLRHITADVTQADTLERHIQPRSLDRLFSYYMLSHVTLSSRDVALRAVHNMATLVADTGTMTVGSHQWVASVSGAEFRAHPEESAAAIVDTTAFGKVDAALQRFNNLARHVFTVGH